MKPTEVSPIPAELMAEIQEAAENALKGIRDPEKAKEARQRMDRIREENRKKFGDAPVGVDIIRELRGTR
jgi:hypothetical protein